MSDVDELDRKAALAREDPAGVVVLSPDEAEGYAWWLRHLSKTRGEAINREYDQRDRADRLERRVAPCWWHRFTARRRRAR